MISKQSRIKLLLSTCILLSLPAMGFADYSQDLHLAEGGNVEAQFRLAECHQTGSCGVIKDLDTAQKWYEKAALSGTSEAQYRLWRFLWLYTDKSFDEPDYLELAANQGHLIAGYINGIFARNNRESEDGEPAPMSAEEEANAIAAEHELTQAAEGGNPEDQYFLGKALVIQDRDEEGIVWLTRAAESGLAHAQHELAWQLDYQDQDYGSINPEAEKWYLLAAKQGVAKSEAELGQMYHSAAGHADNEQDAAKYSTLASKWLHSAAEKGQVSAYRDLGDFYYQGAGHPKDFQKALEWFLKADKYANETQAHLFAMLDSTKVGDIYYEGGYGVSKDLYKARDWYKKAAEADNAEGAFKYAMMNYAGEGGPDSKEEARIWFLKSLDGMGVWYMFGNTGTTYFYLGNIYLNGTEEQAADYHLAEKYFTQAAEEGVNEAKYNLGIMYFNGKGVKKDYAKAMEWFKQVAENGEADAQYFVGHMYSEGLGKASCEEIGDSLKRSLCISSRALQSKYSSTSYEVKDAPDYREAQKWYLMAAKQDHKDSQYELGLIYLRGNGIPQDYQEARKWLLKAANHNHLGAQYSLGHIYFTGKGVPKNYAEAIRWFGKIANTGDEQSQLILGFIYSEGGYGVSQNYVHAHKWYNICAAAGNARAKKYRDELAKKMTLAQLTEAQKLARSWRPAW